MWRRRSWFSLKGKVGIRGSAGEPPSYSSPAPGATGRIRATTQRVIEDRSEHRVSPRRHRPSLNRGRSQIRQAPGGDWRRWRDEQVKTVEEVCQAPEQLFA